MTLLPVRAASFIGKAPQSSWSQLSRRCGLCFLVAWAQISQVEATFDFSTESKEKKPQWIDVYAPPVPAGTPLAPWQIAGLQSVLNHPDRAIQQQGIELLKQLVAAGYDGAPLSPEILKLLRSHSDLSVSSFGLHTLAAEIAVQDQSIELRKSMISLLAEKKLELSSLYLSFLAKGGDQALPVANQLIERLLSISVYERGFAEHWTPWADALHTLTEQSPAILTLVKEHASMAKTDEARLKLDGFVCWDRQRAQDTARSLLSSDNDHVKFRAACLLGRAGIPALVALALSLEYPNERDMLLKTGIKSRSLEELADAAEPYADEVFQRLAMVLKDPLSSRHSHQKAATFVKLLAKNIASQTSTNVICTKIDLLNHITFISESERTPQLLASIIHDEDATQRAQTIWQSIMADPPGSRDNLLKALGDEGAMEEFIIPTLIQYFRNTPEPRPGFFDLAADVAETSPEVTSVLMTLLTCASPATQEGAAKALVKIGPRAVGACSLLPPLKIPAIILALTNGNSHKALTRALTTYGVGPDAAACIVSELQSKNPQRQRLAKDLLLATIRSEWIEEHFPTAGDIDQVIKFKETLANALPVLTSALSSDESSAADSSEVIRFMGEAALPAVPDLIAILDSNADSETKIRILGSMKSLGKAAAVATPGLARLLDSEDPETFQATMELLSAWGTASEPLVDKLVGLLNRNLPWHRKILVAETLTKINPSLPSVSEALLQFLKQASQSSPKDSWGSSRDYVAIADALHAAKTPAPKLAPALVSASLSLSDQRYLSNGVPADDPSALTLCLSAAIHLNPEDSPGEKLVAYHRFADRAPVAFMMNFLGTSPLQANMANAWLIYQAGGDPNLLWLQETIQRSLLRDLGPPPPASGEEAAARLRFLLTILPKVAKPPHFDKFFYSQHNMLIRTLENETLRLVDFLPASADSLPLLHDLARTVESQGTKALFQQRLTAMQSQLTTRHTLSIVLVTAGPVTLYFLLLLAIYRWRPAWLVPLALAAGRPGIPLLLRRAACSRRALDAWLWPQLSGAKARLKEKAEVRPHLTYVERPVAVHQDGGQEIKTLHSTLEAATLCRTQLGSTGSTIGQISGIGGTGKSALVTQLGLHFLAPAENDEDRRTRTPILPLLAYQLGTRKVSSRLQQACEELLHEGTVPGWLLTRLLATGRAVPVFEAVSEMSAEEFTNLKEWLEDGSCPASLCLLTTRRTFAFSDRKTVELRPVLVGRNEVNAFTLGYLKQRSASA